MCLSCLAILEGAGICTVPVLHRGSATVEQLRALIVPSAYESAFENPLSGRTDNLVESPYFRTKAAGKVTRRAKLVRPEFVKKVKQSEYWQHQAMVPNLLADGAEPTNTTASRSCTRSLTQIIHSVQNKSLRSASKG